MPCEREGRRILCDNAVDSYWQGGIGLALSHAAATGKLVPSKDPRSHREFYGPLTMVTADNADQWLKPRDPKNYDSRPFWKNFGTDQLLRMRRVTEAQSTCPHVDVGGADWRNLRRRCRDSPRFRGHRVNLIPVIALSGGIRHCARLDSCRFEPARSWSKARSRHLVTGCSFVVMSGAIDLSIEGVMATTSVARRALRRQYDQSQRFRLVWRRSGDRRRSAVRRLQQVGRRLCLRIPLFVVTLGTWSIGVGVGTSLLATFASNGNPGLQQGWLRDLALLGPLSLSNITLIAAVVACVGWSCSIIRPSAGASSPSAAAKRIARIPDTVQRVQVRGVRFRRRAVWTAGVLTSARLEPGPCSVGADTLFTAITAVVIGGTPLSGGRGGVLQSVVGITSPCRSSRTA